MMRKALLVLLGNQLFPIEEIKKTQVDMISVSYTHLTLPTIYSV